MTTTALPATCTAWDEPAGVAARGTLLVLPGRGESAASYARLGRRLAADAYRVRVVEVDLDDLAGSRARVEAALLDDTLPAPRVLVGADTGATLAAHLLDAAQVDAAVLAGQVLATSSLTGGDFDDELEARTACPAHRRVLTEDSGFHRGGLGQQPPSNWLTAPPARSSKPVLVLHGSADPVTPAADAFAAHRHVDGAELQLVLGARHDVLNDVSHRSVAATVVLFLERLRLGRDLPAVLRRVP